MITNITLDNFKCFRKLELSPRLVTVLIGPNGTGKSSVLQAMALLKQSAGNPRAVLSGGMLNLQSYNQLEPTWADGGSPQGVGFGGTHSIPAGLSSFTGPIVEYFYKVNCPGFDGDSSH
jgi:energy-coupling factor transporter ATP-binding protein EcfA2